MKLLLFLISLVMFGQGTDLPGPVAALPDASANPTGVCSWNGAQTFKTCVVTNAAIAADFTVTLQAANYIVAGINIGQTWSGTQVFGGDINISNINDSAGTVMISSAGRALWNITTFNTNVFFPSDATERIGTAADRAKEIYTAAGYFWDAASGGGVGACTITGSASHMQCANLSVSGNCIFGGEGMNCIDVIVPEINIDGMAGTIAAHSLAGGSVSAVCASAGGVLQISGCPGGGTVTSVTGTSPIGSSGGATPAISCSTCAVKNATNVFTAMQDIHAQLDINGTQLFDINRGVWNLGDFNTALTMSADNTWDFGTSSKRIRTIEAVTVNTRGSSPTICATTGGGLNCSGTGQLVQVLSTGTNDLCNLSAENIKCAVIGGFSTTVNIVAATGAASFSGPLTAATINGIKHASGVAQLSSGVDTVATGLSSVSSFVATFRNNATPGEDIEADAPSGGNVQVRSSNTSSNAFFTWMADGN